MNISKQNEQYQQQISLLLTPPNTQLSINSRPNTHQQLQYSQSFIPTPKKILQSLEISIKIQHQPKKKSTLNHKRRNHFISDSSRVDVDETILHCFNLVLDKSKLPQKSKSKHIKQHTNRSKQGQFSINMNKNIKYRSHTHENHQNDQKMSKDRSKTMLNLDLLCQSKQNQEQCDYNKVKISEEKRKKIFFNKSSQKQSCQKSFSPRNLDKSLLSIINNSFFTKKIHLGNNQAQQKKYLQKILQNRQMTLHRSPKHAIFPLI